MSFDQFPLLANLAIFAVSAGFVWAAGTRLTAYVDGIASLTGIGQAFAGMLLLGGITSLPEIATATTASWTGNPSLAVSNLLGSAAANILLLAMADAIIGRDALTSVVAAPATLFQGTLGMMLLGGVAVVVTIGDVAVLGVGVGSTLLMAGCVASLWLSSGYERRHVWTAVGKEQEKEEEGEEEGVEDEKPGQPLRSLVLKTVAAGATILVAGFFLSQTGDAIAAQTGLGTGLVGLVLVAFATSLPELSSITAALRLHRYEMAVGDLFGTNLFNIALLFIADLAYGGGPVLAEGGRFEAVAALLGLLLTGVFVLGLLERKDRTVLRMGYDSLAALAFYAAGLAVLYPLAP
ncbi:sodium:calcium antiporter [Azospirillum sp. SYSU D00513]|uniref:sodium:calcium antiporter n=1 Tax=Azospirillum sp. SYSU D00513 TaxID=2812561 RepID=UPI001A95DFD9|nr:sodium:calcium antiporter [Azospirillum sp. SYSU D00513]